jgi:hypothetical protein
MTAHFRCDVIGPNRRPDREEITYDRCVRIVKDARYTERRGDEWLFWGFAPEVGRQGKWLRVVTDKGRESLITAHQDRNFARRIERER